MTYLSSSQIAGTGSVNRSQAETSVETAAPLPALRACADYWLSNGSQPFLSLPFPPEIPNNGLQWITLEIFQYFNMTRLRKFNMQKINSMK